MPELRSDLEELAEQVARDAYPLPVTEVMRRGDRRRRVRIAGELAAVIAVVAIATGGILAGTAATRPGSPLPATRPTPAAPGATRTGSPMPSPVPSRHGPIQSPPAPVPSSSPMVSSGRPGPSPDHSPTPSDRPSTSSPSPSGSPSSSPRPTG
ncbi:MAG TPA: hypothetical protein VK823_20470 [Streptosporangiaceae bacterium]|nr:hypothetical protein [Streptosporangiaceae bacterium]